MVGLGASGNGHFAIGKDVLYDFRPEEGDLLDLLAYGFGDSADPLDIDGLVYGVSGGSTTIDVGASFGIGAPGQHTIKLVGFDGLDDSNFAALA